MELEKINLVENLDQIIESKVTTSNAGNGGTKLPGTDPVSAEAGMNFNNMRIDRQTPNIAQSQQAGILRILWWLYQQWLKKKNRGGAVQPPQPKLESSLNEDMGYDNPYAIRQPVSYTHLTLPTILRV